jgi:U3 small nucleolar RNA-associated protein 10
MPSSLAAQLTQGASLNAAFLTDRSKRKATESYLFTGRDAAQHELDTIHALAVNGLLQLRSLDRRLGAFEDSLFSSASRDVDRTLQTKEENARLDATVEEFLTLLGPFVLEAPTGKVLEWLVRRFRCVNTYITLVVKNRL